MAEGFANIELKWSKLDPPRCVVGLPYDDMAGGHNVSRSNHHTGTPACLGFHLPARAPGKRRVREYISIFRAKDGGRVA